MGLKYNPCPFIIQGSFKMYTLLMCKDTPVYNISTNEVLNTQLLPGYMRVMSNNPNKFKHWLKLRYSSNTNSLARQLKGITFGQGNRVRINRETHALSLSDSYWIKESNDKCKFNQISPYYTVFWTGTGYYSGQSIPTLYTPGYLNKYWIDSKTLCKIGKETLIEVECARLCKLCGIPVNNIIQRDQNSILIENITSPKYMLEQADQSGMIDPDDFDNTNIIKHFGLSGIQMIIIDAIIGNGDRHAGNFGWLRDTDTGKYVCMAPLYDFDHALDSKSTSDLLIQDAVQSCNTKEYVLEALGICSIVVNSDTLDIFKTRANTILNILSSKVQSQ